MQARQQQAEVEQQEWIRLQQAAQYAVQMQQQQLQQMPQNEEEDYS